MTLRRVATSLVEHCLFEGTAVDLVKLDGSPKSDRCWGAKRLQAMVTEWMPSRKKRLAFSSSMGSTIDAVYASSSSTKSCTSVTDLKKSGLPLECRTAQFEHSQNSHSQRVSSAPLLRACDFQENENCIKSAAGHDELKLAEKQQIATFCQVNALKSTPSGLVMRR